MQYQDDVENDGLPVTAISSINLAGSVATHPVEQAEDVEQEDQQNSTTHSQSWDGT